jgi:HK97 family phage prohead protease
MMTKRFTGKIKSVTNDFETKSAPNGDMQIAGWASKPVIDRYNEVVDAQAFEGTLEGFAKNPIMLFGHDPKQPIGTFPKLELRSDGLWVGGVIGHGFEPADTVRKQVEQKILRTMSIGFRELKRGVMDKAGIYHITSLELLEISIVSIPANQDALFEQDTTGKLLSITLSDPIHRQLPKTLTDAEPAMVKTLQREIDTLRVQLGIRDLLRDRDAREARRAALIKKLIAAQSRAKRLLDLAAERELGDWSDVAPYTARSR